MIRESSSIRPRRPASAPTVVEGSKRKNAAGQLPFNVEEFLESTGAETRVIEYGRGDVIFRQGEPCDSVLYLQKGTVKVSVLSRAGRQAVIAMLAPGDFFGEGGLAGQPVRVATATATTAAAVRVVGQGEMVRLLHAEPAMSDRLMAYLLARVIHVEEELVDQLFNDSEKRLARKLLLLARYGDPHGALRTVPPISQETLAEMVGTTRARVNFFIKKFERLGFVSRTNGLQVNNSLLTVALHD